jgi:hypothetical protein
MIPWVCLAVAAAGGAVAVWTQRRRREVWPDMGQVFDVL